MGELLVGKLLVEKGFLTKEDFLKVLKFQIAEKNGGKSVTLGEAMNNVFPALFDRISLQV